MTDDEDDRDRSWREQFDEMREERDRQRQLDSVRRQAILANPEGVQTATILAALDRLDEDEANAWLDEHPDVREQLTNQFAAALEAMSDIVESIPDEAIEQYNQRVEFALDEGNYENTVLETPDGDRHDAGLINFWATDYYGQKLIDIRERNIPEDVDLVGSHVEIRNDDGILLLAGEIVEEGGRMAGDGIINNQTVVVEPVGMETNA